MREYRLIIILLDASPIAAGLSYAAPVTVNGETGHFKRELVINVYAFNAGSIVHPAQLAQVRPTTLNAAKKTSSVVGYTIRLNDSDTLDSAKATFSLSGVIANSINFANSRIKKRSGSSPGLFNSDEASLWS